MTATTQTDVRPTTPDEILPMDLPHKVVISARYAPLPSAYGDPDVFAYRAYIVLAIGRADAMRQAVTAAKLNDAENETPALAYEVESCTQLPDDELDLIIRYINTAIPY